MRVSKSSANSRPSDAGTLAGVILLLAAIGIGAAALSVSRGYTLYDGDAESHLDIARKIVDSRTPGFEQLGTVWLPLPHLLMVPFAARDAWWRSGAAGAIPSCAGFILAGTLLFAAARRMYGSNAAALTVALLFALNPNMLYLQSTAMTEPIELAAVAALVWSTLWFRDSQSVWAIIAAAAASNLGTMTRYESWFLIPFVTLYLLIVAEKKSHAVAFGAIASLGPIAWLAHNQYYNGNALEFYNGPYSAAALMRRQAAQGLLYPTDHHWGAAIQYYRTAARLVVGRPLLLAGLSGAAVALWKRTWWPLALVALIPVFFVWSLHSGGTVLTLPELGPWSLLNTRYAIIALPLAALAAGAWTTLLPSRRQAVSAVAVAALLSVPMWLAPAICWQEAEHNSEARRSWTGQAADYLAANYRTGTGIVFTFGSGFAEVLRRAGIPLAQGLHEGNGAAWDAAISQPETFLREEWVLTMPGDAVSAALARAESRGLHYQLRRQIPVKGAPPVEIYQRQSHSIDRPVH
jgi:hypothetical protein